MRRYIPKYLSKQTNLCKDEESTNNYCNIKDNDEVTTSNLGRFDEMIKIGKISKIIKDENLISDIYEITTYVNFNDLHYLIILSGEIQ